MNLQLCLADICWAFTLQRAIDIESEFQPFLTEGVNVDVSVMVSWDRDIMPLPTTQPVGDDLLLAYYQEGPRWYCMTKGGNNLYVASARYTADRMDIICVINKELFSVHGPSLGNLLRFLPMRDFFLRFGTLFLHSSQIVYRGKGLLFTAPSGTGKTTQAKLWRQHRGAEILCNDRTLTRKVDGVWRTYGYPVDGSEPVRSNRVNFLGAMVLLKQGSENRVERLGPSKALPLLMRQVVIDCWSGEARASAMELLITLMEDIPVYLLTCTPEEQAVETLEAKLMEDEVIPRGKDF